MLKFPFGIYNFKIKSYDTDHNGKLTLPTIFHLLQECAWENAQANEFGFEDLEKQNAFWVLSKIYIEINEYPEWKDDIEIKTWPKGIDGLFAIRDFQIFNQGKIVARATSYWLILDQSTKRPKRLEQFNFIHENFFKENAIAKVLGKVPFQGDLAELDKRKVYYSDLDVNKHVNNATYVRWILDSYFSEENINISEFEINFLTELKLNDIFTVNKSFEECVYYYILKNKANKDVCKVKMK
ncbi:MAG: hypothetical protein JEY96_08845 [Bacteroidales bacterium]|nr:hypothetical protein [Bacteroidales bacterium]